MDDRIPHGSQVLANVVRDFVGSRLERQLLAQAFELAWHGSQITVASDGAGEISSSSSRGGPTTTSFVTSRSAVGA